MSELLAFVHSLVTTFSTLYTSLSSYSFTTITITTITITTTIIIFQMLTLRSPRFLTVQLRVAVFPSTAEMFLTLRTPDNYNSYYSYVYMYIIAFYYIIFKLGTPENAILR